jgi:rod shape-determining protein MreD
MAAGLVAGLLEDTLTNPDRLLGLHAFSKVLVGYLVAMLGARTVVEKPIAVGGLVAGAALLETGIVVGLIWVLRGTLLLPAPGPLAAGAVATGLVGAAIQALSLVPWRARREARRRRRLSL